MEMKCIQECGLDKRILLGSGAFGQVYKGTIDDSDVAFKTTKSTQVSQLKNFLSEVKIMIHIGKHPNVVGIVGAYTAEIRDGI
jgi:serine/threonine protein kinase